MQTNRRLGLEAFMALLVLAVSACTGSSAGPTATTTGATSLSSPTPFPSPSPPPGPPIVLNGRMVFANDRDGNVDVWVMDLPSGKLHRLTTDPNLDFSPTWSPDGKHIAFRSDRRGNDEVFVMNADGTGQRNLTRNPASDYSPAWSPDGRTIAFATARSNDPNDLWLMNSNGSHPRPLVEQVGIDEYPVWSPDGSQVAFSCTLGTILASRVGDFEVCVVNADGTGLRRITDDRGISHPAGWSPDGSFIVFASNRDQNPGDVSPCGDIYVIRPDGSDLRGITDGSQEYALRRFRPTGTSSSAPTGAILASRATCG